MGRFVNPNNQEISHCPNWNIVPTFLFDILSSIYLFKKNKKNKKTKQTLIKKWHVNRRYSNLY